MMRNTTILALAILLGVSYARADAAAEDDDPVYRVPIDGAPYRGPAAAKVTIVEFADFQCPFCARSTATMAELQKRYGAELKLVFRHNPLPFHVNARVAAEASMAAWSQGKFWEMHDLLFANQAALARADLDRYAAELSLDMARFAKDVDTSAADARIESDIALADKLGARGTPTFYVNGHLVKGAQPVEKFAKVIDRELVAARAVVAKGVPLARVYDELTRAGLTEGLPPAVILVKQEGLDPAMIYSVPVGASPVRGPEGAKVTIVEFTDYQCPFCQRAEDTLLSLRVRYPTDVRIVAKHLPLEFHKNAELAAWAAIAAAEQGQFWAMHDILFAHQQELARADVERYAQQLGLDLVRFRAALDGKKGSATVTADGELAMRLGVVGTPYFFINGQPLAGAPPFDKFVEVIEAQRQRADALLAKGVTVGKLYVALTTPSEIDQMLTTLTACKAKDAAMAKEAYDTLKGARRKLVRDDCKTLGVELAK